jgi:hypothetical protein
MRFGVVVITLRRMNEDEDGGLGNVKGMKPDAPTIGIARRWRRPVRHSSSVAATTSIQCGFAPHRPRSTHLLHSGVSRPLEDCEGCPALAGVRNLGLDDPSAGCSDLHCNFGGGGRRPVCGRLGPVLGSPRCVGCRAAGRCVGGGRASKPRSSTTPTGSSSTTPLRWGTRPTPRSWPRAIERITTRTGHTPRAVTADRGYGQASVEHDLHQPGVRSVAIPGASKPSAARREFEHRRAFRDKVKWRTGSEGRINHSNEATAGAAPNSPASTEPEPGAHTASSPTTWSKSAPSQHEPTPKLQGSTRPQYPRIVTAPTNRSSGRSS